MEATQALLDEAQACVIDGRLDDAQRKLESAAALDPVNPAIHHAIGVVAYRRGRFEESVAALRRAVELHPRFHQAFNACGLALKALDRFEEAGRMFAGALALQPTYDEAAYNLGVLLQDREPQLAERYYRAALAANPGSPAILGNLGNLLRRTGRVRDAEPLLRRAAELSPADANALGNLALACLELGDTIQAHALAQRAAGLAPREALWWDTAGSALLGTDPDAAVPFLERARSLAPQDAEAALKLGLAREESGDYEGALRNLAEAKRLAPENEPIRWAEALALPAIVADDAAALAAVERFDRGVEAIDRELRLDTAAERAAALEAARMDGPFSLHYLPGEHVERQARFAALVARVARAALPQFATAPATPARAERLRVGFVSSFLRTHVITRFFGASMTQLDPREFERHAWLAGGRADAVSESIARAIDRFESVPADPEVVAQRIRDARLDVLVFPDIGLDPLMTVLASLRLAPVQAAFYGHPATTGLDSIDDFLAAMPWSRRMAPRTIASISYACPASAAVRLRLHRPATARGSRRCACPAGRSCFARRIRASSRPRSTRRSPKPSRAHRDASSSSIAERASRGAFSIDCALISRRAASIPREWSPRRCAATRSTWAAWTARTSSSTRRDSPAAPRASTRWGSAFRWLRSRGGTPAGARRPR